MLHLFQIGTPVLSWTRLEYEPPTRCMPFVGMPGLFAEIRHLAKFLPRLTLKQDLPHLYSFPPSVTGNTGMIHHTQPLKTFVDIDSMKLFLFNL
jgi:hypothetical protein